MNTILRILSLFLLGVISALSPAVAGEATAPALGKQVTAHLLDDDERIDLWHTDLRVDGWIMQLSIRVNDSSAGFSKSFFIGIGDIVKNVDWIAPFGADIRYGRFGFLPDIVAARISGRADSGGQGLLFTGANIDLRLAATNLPFYYRLIDEPGFSLDLVGGARYLWVDQKTTLRGGLLDGTESKIVANIWDAIGGLRVRGDVNEKWFYSIYGDAGAGDSDFTWQAWGDLGYRWSEKTSISVGYRYLVWDEKSGPATVGLTASGPIIVLTKHF